MISSSILAKSIVNDLDQNAYTTRHDQNKILVTLNNACEYVLAYQSWSWSLKFFEKEVTEKTSDFTFDTGIFYPYWGLLNGSKIKRTNIPIVGLASEESDIFFVNGNTVRTGSEGLSLKILGHRAHKKLIKLGDDDIDMPDTMFQALKHVTLWFIYPGGLDIGSSLANQNFQMAKSLLDTYKKAYGFDLQPSSVEAAGIYTR